MSTNFSSLLPLLLGGGLSTSSTSSSSSSLSGLFGNPLSLLLGSGSLGSSSSSSGLDFSSLGLLGGVSGGGGDLSSMIALLQLLNKDEDEKPATSSTTSSTSTSSSSSTTTAKSSVSIAAGNPILVDDYARSIDQNGNVNNASITARFKNLGLNDEQANDLARVNIIEQYAKEFVLGKRVGTNRDEQDRLAAITLDFSKPGDTFAAVASTYKNDGGNYNNAKLKTLLQNTGNQDLADDGGVGTTDVQTLAAVRTALNRGTLKLNQVYSGPGDTTYINNAGKYDRAIKYVTQGGLAADIKDLENGVKNKDLNTLSKVSDGVSNQNADNIRTDASANGNGSSSTTSSSGSSTTGYGSSGSSSSTSSTSTPKKTAASSSSTSSASNTLTKLRDKLLELLPLLLISQLLQSFFQPAQQPHNPYAGFGMSPLSSGSTNPFGTGRFII